MTKATMNSILSLISSIDTPEAAVVREAITAELAKGEAKAQANRDLYATAKPIVLEGLARASAPVTIGELFEDIATELPEGFTKGKVQYLITRVMTDEVVKVEGKVNTYTLKA